MTYFIGMIRGEEIYVDDPNGKRATKAYMNPDFKHRLECKPSDRNKNHQGHIYHCDYCNQDTVEPRKLCGETTCPTCGGWLNVDEDELQPLEVTEEQIITYRPEPSDYGCPLIR